MAEKTCATCAALYAVLNPLMLLTQAPACLHQSACKLCAAHAHHSPQQHIIVAEEHSHRLSEK